MKRAILLILSAIALCFVSCQPVEEFGKVLPDAEDGKITVDLSLSIPTADVSTKALGSTAAIRNIYVAVFGYNHYLNEFVKAIPYRDVAGGGKEIAVDGSGNLVYEPDGSGNYHVRITLTQTTSTRHVHVLANLDETQLPDFNAYENTVMAEKLVSDDGDGYWQYRYFSGGFPNEATVTAAFNGLKLIRNFAWIDVRKASNLTAYSLDAFEVYNTPDVGLFPAISGIDGSGNYTYVNAYESKTFDQVLALPYRGYLSPLATLQPELESGQTFPDNIPTAFASSAGTNSKFVYENPRNGNEGSTFVIVKMTKTSESPKYYRLDFKNNDGPVPVLRNFHYTITISGIGSAGYDTPREAAQHPSTDNLFAGMDISSLTELNNGISSMRVSFTEKVFTSAKTGTGFSYLFTPDLSQPTSYAAAELSAPSNSAVITSTSADWYDGGTENSTTHWREVTFNVAAPGSSQESSTFTVKGTDPTSGASLTQTITVISMPVQTFTKTLSGPTDGVYTLDITLPDDLPKSIFPLEIEFDQSGNKIAPVGTGTSTDFSDNTTIKYVKQVLYDDYQSNKHVVFTFKAVKTLSSGDTLKFRDKRSTQHDPYFNEGSVTLS